MNVTKEVKYIDEEVTHYICDKCGRQEAVNSLEGQEYLRIWDTGGYSSIFGDGSVIEAEFCQYCAKELLGQYIRIS